MSPGKHVCQCALLLKRYMLGTDAADKRAVLVLRGLRSCLVTRYRDLCSNSQAHATPEPTCSPRQQRDASSRADLKAQELRSAVHVGVEDEALDDLQGRCQERRVMEGASLQSGPLLMQQMKQIRCCLDNHMMHAW